ncbi:hypothetical protein GCM10023189_00080 [Nibrella saemangeumensis]|uniref:Outer membrane protein beta-barrel domain-containing protein n=1 Tax=Nibrella saemangeumensis TaxID=1084526 RepID=A0ABP8M9S0_9BACT
MFSFRTILMVAAIALPILSNAQCGNSSRSDFGIYLGFNNYNQSAPANYELNTGGSRFVALGWRRNLRLVNGTGAALRLGIGPEIAWNNFMFENKNVLAERNNQLFVEPASIDVKKSKLTVAQLNLPVLLNLSFKPSRLSIGVGAYAGVRVDSYTKVKPVVGDTERTKGSYNLNNVRWGLMTELGWSGRSKLFFRYEPTTLFRTNEGPELNVWAVGVRL